MGTFDELLAEAREKGVDEDILARIQAATDASPLRAELKAAKEAESAARELAAKYAGDARKRAFEAAGIKIDPNVLKLPEDRDLTDLEEVKEWGKAAGLIVAEEAAPTEPSEQAKLRDMGTQPASAGAVGDKSLDLASVKSFADLVSQASAAGWGDGRGR